MLTSNGTDKPIGRFRAIWRLLAGHPGGVRWKHDWDPRVPFPPDAVARKMGLFDLADEPRKP